jgi:hypothetical protein
LLIHEESSRSPFSREGEKIMVWVLFTKIGWMKRYKGPAVDDVRPIEGGAYTESELGYEAFNFLPIQGGYMDSSSLRHRFDR